MKFKTTVIVGLFFISACSSTNTRSGPAATLEALNLLSGGKPIGLPADWKHPITIFGSITRDAKCFVSMDRLRVDVETLEPDSAKVCTASPTDDGAFHMICVTEAGRQNVRLISLADGGVIQTYAISSSKTDRFAINFNACSPSER